MIRFGGLKAVGLGVLALAFVLAGCASPPEGPAPRPPKVVVPGVGPGDQSAAGGAGGSAGSGRSGSASGAAGSRGRIVLGGWAPGGARNAVPAGALAYFRWLNAHGGVFGRRIDYRVLDDHGDVRLVPSLAHRLVQGQAVFAVFGAAGVPGTAVSGFLDAAGVPDVFAGSGCSCVNAPSRLPEVFGWPLGDVREAMILGAYVAQHYAGMKAGVLFGPDAAGRDAAAAFTRAARAVRVAARIPVAGRSQAAPAARTARAAGARVLVAFTSRAVVRQLAEGTLPVVAAGSGLAAGLPDGVITDGFLPSARAPARSPAASWVGLFGKIRARYLPKMALSPAVIDGMASAYEMAAALFRAGPALTRPGLVAALDGLPPGPAGVPLAYSAADHGGPLGGYVGVIKGGALVPGTGLMVTSAGLGAVTPYPGTWVSAPPDGVPPH